MKLGLMSQSPNPTATGSALRMYPEIRPWAVMTRSCRRMENRERMVVARLSRISARFPHLPLNQNGRGEHPRVHQVDPVRHTKDRVVEGHSESELIEEGAGIRLRTGSGVSSATIPRPDVKGWPARMARVMRSIASGSPCLERAESALPPVSHDHIGKDPADDRGKDRNGQTSP